QKAQLTLFSGLRTYAVTSFMLIDSNTRRNLELVATARDASYRGSLLSVIDHTRTAMGARKLRQWLLHPLLDAGEIAERQDAIAGEIADTINDTPPISVTEGGVIRTGVSGEVDELRSALEGSKEWLAAFEAKEKERTGIKSLKVNFNKAFGYYIEITNANKHL